MKQKVGIYSGTFDPVHEGHLAFAREAVKQCGLDKVFFLVEPKPRRKQGVKAFDHRTRMVQLAIWNEPKFGSIITEQQRFTVDETLPLLTERFRGAELCMLIGDDGLNHLSGWPHVDELLHNVFFVIGLRKLTKTEAKQQLANIMQARGIKIRYQLFESPKPNISSTGLKQSIRRGGQPDGLPLSVSDYINSQGLYKPKS